MRFHRTEPDLLELHIHQFCTGFVSEGVSIAGHSRRVHILLKNLPGAAGSQ
ncbi:hypothetical protein BMS3Abin05_00559 [bacterium BMS3Abin05]|nr:hypothetical protein BMS3Abin05_00559 [bacterium BMS3Abin05]